MRLSKKLHDENGGIDTGGILIMGIGMVFIAVGFIMYPIIMTSSDSLLSYVYSPCTTINSTYFTGFNAIVGITPLLVLVGFLTAGVFAMYLGVRVIKGALSATLDLGKMLLLSLSMIFIAIGLIILPVALDGVSGVLDSESTTSDGESYITGDSDIGNVTLTRELACYSIGKVISITSNVTLDVPVADNYTHPRLYITGMTANSTHNLTTSYYYIDNLVGYTGLYQILRVTPLLILIAFVSGAVVSGYFGLKKIGQE